MPFFAVLSGARKLNNTEQGLRDNGNTKIEDVSFPEVFKNLSPERMTGSYKGRGVIGIEEI